MPKTALRTFFVKAMSAEFNDEKHERAWLTVTAKNLCRDRLKHWWRKKTEPIDDYAETLSGGTDKDDMISLIKHFTSQAQ